MHTVLHVQRDGTAFTLSLSIVRGEISIRPYAELAGALRDFDAAQIAVQQGDSYRGNETSVTCFLAPDNTGGLDSVIKFYLNHPDLFLALKEQPSHIKTMRAIRQATSCGLDDSELFYNQYVKE